MSSEPLNICLAGAGGVPGRNILSSLPSNHSFQFALTILRRPSTASALPENKLGPYHTIHVDFDDQAALLRTIKDLAPDIVISALNAEPTPTLDLRLARAIYQAVTSAHWIKPVVFINGYTLDILHPCVSEIHQDQIEKLTPKRDLADLLVLLSKESWTTHL